MTTQLCSVPSGGLEFCFVGVFFQAKNNSSYLLAPTSTVIKPKNSEVNTIAHLRPNKLLLQDGKLFDVHCFLTDAI